MAISFPESKSVCEPYFDTIFDPIISVAVDFPQERMINGMAFSTELLSDQMLEQLFEPLGGTNVFPRDKCQDANATAQFDEGSRNMAQAVLAGQADAETNERLNQIREFARSIAVLPDVCIPVLHRGPIQPSVTAIYDLAWFDLAPFEVITQTQSPDGWFVAVVAAGSVDGEAQSLLAVLDIATYEVHELRRYQSLDWGDVEIAWGPEASWMQEGHYGLAYLVSNAAYADDNGLWVYSALDRTDYHFANAQSIEGWDDIGQSVYFTFKDAYGYVDTHRGQSAFGPPCALMP